jgi:multidrug efflux pump subunit AcrB/outer membrane protein TolC
VSITARILDNRHAIAALVIAAFVFGAVAYQSIPVRLFPDTAPPLVNVVTPWPGTGASDVARDLGRVLEEEFASLEGVVTVKSTSQDNLSLISIEFQYGTEVKLAAVDVQNALARIGEELPDGSEQPRVMTFSTADRPVYTVGVASDDLIEARRLATDVVAPRLQQMSGVAAVDVFGGRTPVVLVDVDPGASEAHRVPLQQVAAAIGGANVSAAAGRLRGTTSETMLRIDQRTARIGDLEAITLQLPDGGQLQVGDLATVTRGAADDDSWFSIDGQRAIAVQVFRSEDANTVAVVRDVQQAVAELTDEYPELRFIQGEETASFTEQSVSNLLSNVWQALVLASLILFLFLGRARASLVTVFTMPLSYGITFGLMHLLGMEFNMVTLSAVILAVGMVVDASVVVLENIIRLRDEEGLSPIEAAIRGTDEVRMPVLAGVATTVMVLVPLLGLAGFVGKVFAPLSATLLLAFGSSIVVALFVVPVLSVYATDGGRLDAIAQRVAAPFQWVMERIRRVYLGLLNIGLRWPALVGLVAVLTFAVGVGGMRKAGMDVLPRMDSGSFSVSLETPSGTSLAETAQAVQQVERVLSEQPEVLLVQAQAGYEAGMHFTGGGGAMGPTQGYVSVTLSPRTEREATIWDVEARVRHRIAEIPGLARVVVKEIGNTAKPTTVAPLVARITGPDPRVLDLLGDEVAERLSTVDNVVEPVRTWHRDLGRLMVRIDEQEAAARGWSVLGVSRVLAGGAEGIPAGNFDVEEGSPEPVRVRYARSADPSLDEVLSWPLFLGQSGQVVPVRSLASAERVVEQALFTTEDLRSVLDVQAQVDGRPLSFVVADAQAELDQIVMPQGYAASIEGENNDLIESRMEIIKALIISVLAVYLLLVAQFRSFLHPLTVMMAVPLSLSGVAVGLHLAGKPVSMPVMVGLVLLVGIVVNNSIILVDIIRQQREAGVERREAIRIGVGTRFRPILMTSLSTIVGMIPLAAEWALGAERFSPLATAVIGGLLASTLLTLVVIPVAYDAADRLSARFSSRTAAAALGLGLLVSASVVGLPSPAMAQAPDAGTTLDEAWELLQGSHPAVDAAMAQVSAARGRSVSAVGRLLPQVGLSARYSRLSYVEAPTIEIPLTLPDGSSPDPMELGESIEDQFSLRMTATQPLFAGGALIEGTRAARAGVSKARAQGDASREQLWQALVESWYGAALADGVVQIQQTRLEAAVAQEERLRELVEQGRATELQLLSISLARAEAEQHLVQAEALATLAAQKLSQLVGGDVSPSIDLVAAAAALVPGESTDGGTRAEVRAAAATLGAAKAKARAAAGSLAPRAALRFGAQYENPNSRYFPAEAEWRPSWDASVVLTWDLDFGITAGTAATARAEARAAEAAMRATTDESILGLAQAQTVYALGFGELGVADERVEVAQRAVQLTAVALEAGRRTATDLLERQRDLALARSAQQRAGYEVLVAAERVRGLTGRFGPQDN